MTAPRPWAVALAAAGMKRAAEIAARPAPILPPETASERFREVQDAANRRAFPRVNIPRMDIARAIAAEATSPEDAAARVALFSESLLAEVLGIMARDLPTDARRAGL